MTITVLNPVGVRKQEEAAELKKLESLKDAVIGILDDGLSQGLMPAIGDLLERTNEGTRVLRYDNDLREHPELIRRIASECDAVVVGACA